MAKFVIALACLAVLFVGSNTYVVSPDVLQQVLDNNAAIAKGVKRNPLTTAPGKAICTTTECVLAAAELLKALDETVDPCEDFFKFACGGWIDKNPIPDSKSRWTQFDILRDELSAEIATILKEANIATDPKPVNQARDFYKACMNTDLLETTGLTPLTDLLELFGGWPMTLRNWQPNSFKWQDATAAGRQLYGTSILLTVYNYLDSKNTSMSSIYIDQTSLVLPRSTLVAPEESAEVMAAYATYITGSAKAIADSLLSGAPDTQIQQDVKDMWKFESELAKITSPAEDRRNNTLLYNPKLLIEVQGWTDNVNPANDHAKINWSKYLNDIYSSADITVPFEERLIVVEVDYLQKLVTLLDKTPLRTIANYVHWRFVNSLASATTQQMRDLQFAFNKVLYGTTAPTPWSQTCADSANNLLGYAISNKYVERNFEEVAKNETKYMISDLKTAFKSLVDEASWMDTATKRIAREKADFMRENVAYPDWIKDKAQIEAYYEGVEVSITDHFGNLQSTNAFVNKEDFKTLRGLTDRERWNTYPTVVNAFYEPELNSITFPAGILQTPFFKYGRLAAQNYGGIGAVIGHEITHGFDDQGRQSDKDGNTANWWSQQTLDNYLDRAQCFINQYNDYTVPSGSHVNGITTQGENIADNGGVREAFRAYTFYVAANGAEPQLPGLEKYSAQQIFFMSYANVWCGTETPERLENQIATDPHSPSRFRVLGPLSNSEDFVREFQCPAGSPMNRANKCVLW